LEAKLKQSNSSTGTSSSLNSPAYLKGWLNKQRGPLHPKKKRYFEQEDPTGRIYYYNEKKSGKGFIDITKIQSVKFENLKILIHIEQREYVLFAENAKAVEYWISGIEHWKNFLQGK